MRAIHRILLVNFIDSDAALLRAAGFNVELGYIGAREKRSSGDVVPYIFPRPLYEYEVYVFNSKLPSEENVVALGTPRNLLEDTRTLQMLIDLGRYRMVRIGFIGALPSFERLVCLGLPEVELVEAHEGVSDLKTITEDRPFCIPALDAAIARMEKQFIAPIGQYVVWRKDPYPIYHLPVVVNRNGDEVAAYGALYGQRSIPIYIILPQLRNSARAVLSLLEVLVDLRADLFPDVKSRGWYESDEFVFREERQIVKEISERITETKAYIESKQEERQNIIERFRFIKEILVASEDAAEADHKLSVNVRKVLEFLGFTVIDMDAKVRNAIKKEDFWVKDENFLAITEVSGTRNKNPKITEYNGIAGRMTTIFKRQELRPEGKNITGLLILNYDTDTHPMKRPRLYTGELEEIAEGAKESEIGLLSTVELYKIAIAVKEGRMSKKDARAAIKQAGRIELAE